MPQSAKVPTQATTNFATATFEQHHASLHRFLMRRLRSEQAAQDLAQEAYLRLLRVEHCDLVRKPRSYLYRIAANLVYELHLRERNEPVTFDSAILDHAAEHPPELADDTGERLGLAQQLDRVLAQLPPLQRAIFILRKRDGLSYPEIARTLRISVHTVKKYLARAVAQCRAARWDR